MVGLRYFLILEIRVSFLVVCLRFGWKFDDNSELISLLRFAHME